MTNPYAAQEPEVPRDYLPPPSAYGPAPQQFTLENDPLVNDTAIYGIGGWFTKLFGVIKRSWTLLLPIFAITYLVPSLAIAMLGAGIGFAALLDAGSVEFGGLVVLILVLIPVLLVTTMLGYGAATYAATRQAAGLAVGLGEALRYGLRRCLGLSGWIFLTALLVGGGVMIVAFCAVNILSYLGVLIALPLIAYGLMATAMVGPAYLFERTSPIGRSFGLLHSAFGKMFGRLFIIALSILLTSGIDQALTLGVDSLPQPGAVKVVATVIGMVVVALIELPLTVFQFSGILVTYAERRGDEGATTTELVNSL